MPDHHIDRTRLSVGRTRLPELDGVRGIAIALVLLWHYPLGVYIPEPGSIGEAIKNALAFSAQGVDLFFVLSGFLIGSIIFQHRQSNKFFLTFYARRVCRLMPLYLAVVGSYCIFQAVPYAQDTQMGNWLVSGTWTQQSSPIPTWSYFVYFQNFFMAESEKWGGQWLAPTWSLAVEEQFYIVAPLLIWLLPARVIPLVLGILVVTAPLFRLWATDYSNSFWPSHILLPGRLDALFIGILAAFYIRDAKVDRWLHENQPLLLRLLSLSGFGIVIMTLSGVRTGQPAMVGFGYTFVAIASLIFILSAVYVQRPWLKRILTNRHLTAMGIISYGVYLIHMPMLGLTALFLGDKFNVLSVALATALTFLLAAASWRVLEKPILAYGRRFEYATQKSHEISVESAEGKCSLAKNSA